MIPNTPAFQFGASTLALGTPVRPWTSGARAIGAAREESAAGVPSVYVHRWEYPFSFSLRFSEDEWADVRAMLVHGMEGGTITYHPQGISGGESYVCYLIQPVAGDDVQPSRDGAFAGMLELPIRLRRTTATPIDSGYF